MNRGIYSVVNGMIASQQALDVISNNLANSNTSGYKADAVLFNEQLERQLKSDKNLNIGTMGSGPVAKSRYTDFRQGAMTNTGNPMNFALEGPGMFAVQAQGGPVEYTRSGEFTQDSTGALITKDGKSVLGSDLSPIQLKPGPVLVSASGQISSTDGTPSYGSIGVFTGNFSKSGSGVFQSSDAVAQSGSNDTTKVNQGSLEASNVNAISTMVDMISMQRAFDMAQKSVLTEDDMTQKLSTILTG